MKPGNLVRIRPDLQYNKNGGVRFFNLFNSTGGMIPGAFPTNQVGIFISNDNEVWVTVNVNGITGSIDKNYIEVIS
jgi:hypothetical protein